MSDFYHGSPHLGRVHGKANDRKFFCYFTGFLEGIVASGHIEPGEVLPLVSTCREFVENCSDPDAADLFQDFECDLLEMESVSVVIDVRCEDIDESCSKSSVNRFLGFCAGIACDGVITFREAEGIVARAAGLGDIATRYGIREVINTAKDAVEDRILSETESHEIAEAICRIVGESYVSTGATEVSSSVSYAEHRIEKFPEDVDGAVFVLTGTFDTHPRGGFEERLLLAGMQSSRSVSKKTDYLVIGGRPSRDWLETNRGTKLIKALELHNTTGRPLLVSEAQLESLLSRDGF